MGKMREPGGAGVSRPRCKGNYVSCVKYISTRRLHDEYRMNANSMYIRYIHGFVVLYLLLLIPRVIIYLTLWWGGTYENTSGSTGEAGGAEGAELAGSDRATVKHGLVLHP